MAKEAKDMLGNPIGLGDFVRITSPEHCFGRIVHVQGGSSLAIEGTRKGGIQPVVTNGKVIVEIILEGEFDPRDLIAHHLLKVVDPMPDAEKQKILSKIKLATQ